MAPLVSYLYSEKYPENANVVSPWHVLLSSVRAAHRGLHLKETKICAPFTGALGATKPKIDRVLADSDMAEDRFELPREFAVIKGRCASCDLLYIF